MKIKCNKDMFNKVYWILIDALVDESIRYIFIYGGSSSSKSYSIIQSIILQCLLAETSNTMVLRKYGADIKDSVYADFKEQLESYNLGQITDAQINLIKCSNGARIRFRGLDDSEKIKGLATFKRVFLEEITQFEHEDFKQIRKRLRGRPGQQIIAAWNPTDEHHWIKTKVIDSFDWENEPHDLDPQSFVKRSVCGSAVCIKTTYLDNYWVVGHPTNPKIGFYDRHTVEDFNRDKKFDPNYYRIYALGEYGLLSTGAEIYKQFNEQRNVFDNTLRKDRKLYLSFDENVLPYVTLTLWQGDSRLKELRQIGEICAESPRNTLEDLLQMFMSKYPDRDIPLVITGDRTSIKEDVKLKKGENFFKIIETRLMEAGYNLTRNLPSKNPSIVNRIAFINDIFSGSGRTGCKVFLHEKAVKTIKDVKYCPEDADGTKLKTKKKNKTTGQSYEIWGHCSDTMDYAVCVFFANEYDEFINSGRKHLVRTYAKKKRIY